MNQSSIVKPTKNYTQELNPTLQAVIESLDVELEAELTRYRKYRRQVEKSPVSQKNSNKQIYKIPELMSVLPVDDQIASSLPLSETESPLENSRTFNTSAKESLPLAIEPPTPAELSMAKKGDVENQNSEKQTSHNGNNSSTAPDNYLESSEKLLESLDKLKSNRQEQSTYLASLFTPLGIASMFLFLISCTTLGYVLMNPSGLSNLGLDRLLKGTSAQKNTNDTNTDSILTRKEQPLPKSPDLTSQEFVDLDLNTLSNINPEPSQFPSPTGRVKPVVPPQISGSANTTSQSTNPSTKLDNLSTTLLPQSTQSSPTPSPIAQPSPQTSISSTTTSPIKSDDGWYYVVVDYVNEESLSKAQQIISDAYVREATNGSKIQMGAFWEPERAKMFLQELRQEGVDAKYYKLKPENY
ncbi:MAG: hypothetical protein F6K40_29195 [Okeania sp. SIO3I5]|uniref:hypothetical protein n=1 Tax=Okeania sp. SIO3I5 TaxID=2607805 RepID=UPI0013B84AB5|nr:hypothetical protein [Okeania sp. SIO3I5]NEQ40096.1 hypothetical protein [Okeania sp. SIO3I5]